MDSIISLQAAQRAICFTFEMSERSIVEPTGFAQSFCVTLELVDLRGFEPRFPPCKRGVLASYHYRPRETYVSNNQLFEVW